MRLLAGLRDDDVKVLAGGQSLVPLMNLRLARPSHLVDITRVAELRGMHREDGEWRIGALTTHAEVEDSAALAESMPMLPFVARHIGYRQIRNRGTIGGSLCHADPVSEWPAVMTALDARFAIAGPGGGRTATASEFFTSTFVTSLEPDELLTEVRFRVPDRAGWGFSEFARRTGDFAVIAAAVVVEASGGVVERARIALAGAAPTPVRAAEAERLLAGAGAADTAVMRRAAAAAAAAADPPGDLHGSAAYRRRLIAVEVERALGAALERAAA